MDGDVEKKSHKSFYYSYNHAYRTYVCMYIPWIMHVNMSEYMLYAVKKPVG